MKLSKKRLLAIIREELFYREFYREGGNSKGQLHEEVEGPPPPEGLSAAGTQALELLNQINDDTDIMGITAWLTAHPKFAQITGD
jgi:hypothetical protein